MEVTYKITGFAICHFHLHLDLRHILWRNVIVLAKVWTFNFNYDSLLQLLITVHDAIRSCSNVIILVKYKANGLNDIARDVLRVWLDPQPPSFTDMSHLINFTQLWFHLLAKFDTFAT
jgi:hypothetical protein